MKKSDRIFRNVCSLTLAALLMLGGVFGTGVRAMTFQPVNGNVTGISWGSNAGETKSQPQETPQETSPDEPQGKPEFNNVSSTYITDGGEYTLAVGDALSLYHPRTPTSPYYAYTWCATAGEELAYLDRGQGTCQVIAQAEGDLVLECCLDYTVLYGYGSDHYTYNYIITIHIIDEAHSGEYDYGTMSGTTCPRCHGDKKVELGGVEVDCTTCGGTGIWP